MGHWTCFLRLFITLTLFCEIFSQDETTTEVFVTDVESAEDSISQDYVDQQLNGTLSDDTDDTNTLLDVDNDYTGAEEGQLFLPVNKKCRCGMSNNPHRIINGEISAPGAWPWMAAIGLAIQDPANPGSTIYKGFCGGSIINDRYILTAAHCVKYMKENGINNFKIIVGDNNITGIPSSTRQVFSIADVKRHPKYSNETVNFDVGLVKLSKTLTFNDNMRSICLGQAGSPYPNKMATVAGWGLTIAGDTNSASNSLKHTTIQVLTNAECVRIFQDPFYYPMTMMCTFAKGTNACNGDSGGPLILSRVSSPQMYKQIGIVSYGVDGCRQMYPTVYTRVKRVLAWIRFATKDGIYCGNSFTP